MKKVSIILMAVAMVAFTACGNKKKSAQQADGKAEQSFEQVQLEAHIQMQVDSIAAMFAKKMPMPGGGMLIDGKVVLSDKEKQIKPDYLTDVQSALQTTTLTQKYHAIAMLTIDRFVAIAYDMDVTEYDQAIKKILTDINDPAFKMLTENGKNTTSEQISGMYQNFYDAEVKNGRINLFWELSGALLIENLYIISQNIDKFMPLFTDQDASDFTLRIFLINQSVEQLVAYYPELATLSKAMQPLNVLNAMDTAEFKSQLLEMKGQLEVIRGSLLK